ncbi:MAG: helix-turn-helix domain-containing protein [Polyangiales bacterium]
MAILAAAEQEFARRGFVAARLEDVAAKVDLKRAALFYHFKDKQSLYDAVVADAFGSLGARLTQAFASDEPITVRIERALEAWVDTVVARPTLARLILRHAAEADEHGKTGIFPNASLYMSAGWALFEEAKKKGEFKPVHDDPFHAASAVIGATVFYVAAMAPLIPGAGMNTLTPEKAAEHKRDAIRTLRLLLGIPTPAAEKRKATASEATKKRAKKKA